MAKNNLFSSSPPRAALCNPREFAGEELRVGAKGPGAVPDGAIFGTGVFHLSLSQ